METLNEIQEWWCISVVSSSHAQSKMEEDFDLNTVNLAAPPSSTGSSRLPHLVWRTTQRLEMRNLHEEVRCRRDLSLLLDPERSSVVVIQEEENLSFESVAIHALVTDLFDRQLLHTDHRDALENALGSHSHSLLTDPNSVFSVSLAALPNGVPHRLLGLAVLHGRFLQACVITSDEESGTKNSRELGLTLASFLGIPHVQQRLLGCTTPDEVRSVVRHWLASPVVGQDLVDIPIHNVPIVKIPFLGIWEDFKRRAPHYWSDFRDGFVGPKHLQKTISAIFFLYFAILLPSLALGQEYSVVTQGTIAIQQVVWMQMVGGLIFAIFGGQGLTVIMTTAPLVLFSNVLFGVSVQLGLPFLPLYAWSGVWAAILMMLLAIFNLSWVVRFLTLFTEEAFAMFISAAFTYSAIRGLVNEFNLSYYCSNNGVVTDCPTRDAALLYFILLFGTVLVALAVRKFRSTLFFSPRIREAISDFALPFGVIMASFFGSYVFRAVPLQPFEFSANGRVFVPVDMLSLPVWAIFAALGFGIVLTILTFIDNGVSSAMMQNESMLLRKGVAYHWDLMIMASIFLISSLFGMPMMTAATPFCNDHVFALADMERVVLDDHVSFRVTYAREHRVSILLVHGAIGLTILALPLPLQYIPVPVLGGVFLFLAATGLDGNSFFDRFLLFFTQASKYPSRDYVRRVPRRILHTYTAIQTLCWACLCVIAFVPNPYANLMFPVVLALLVLVRNFVIPRWFVPPQYLYVLD